MKKIRIAIISIIPLFSSCLNSFLEVNPLTDISSEIYWKTEKDVRAALNATYVPLKNAYRSGYLTWLEARSDNFIGNSSGANPYQDYSFNKLSSSMPSSSWNHWYKCISYANYSIHFIPRMGNVMPITNKKHYLSEAYFLRAYSYFMLYRIWGDAPLITEPVLKQSQITRPSKTKKETIMKQIVADIDSALLGVNNSVNELYIYSAGALYALATEVAMWNKDYDKAITYSQSLYDLQQHSIVDAPFVNVCAKADTKDNIWTLKWSQTLDGDNPITVTLGNSGNLLIPARPVYVKWRDLARDDKRRIATIDTLKIASYGNNHITRLPAGAQCWKWSPEEHLAQAEYKDCPIPIYRLADITLLRAEALNKKKNYQEAIDEMNKVRLRAGLPNKTVTDFYAEGTNQVDELLLEEAILQERQFELFAEGKRWFDLMRTGRIQQVMNNHFEEYIKAYGGKDYKPFNAEWQEYWPILQDLINENPKIIQTGSY